MKRVLITIALAFAVSLLLEGPAGWRLTDESLGASRRRRNSYRARRYRERSSEPRDERSKPIPGQRFEPGLPQMGRIKGDADEVDRVYQECVDKMSESFCKVYLLLDEGKTKEAAAEFRSSFAPQVVRLFMKAQNTAPKRYEKYKKWKYRVRELNNLVRKILAILRGENFPALRKELDSIRMLFYCIHRDNKMNFANDAILSFKLKLDGIRPASGIPKNEAVALAKLIKEIDDAAFSLRMEENEDAFYEDCEKWASEAKAILGSDGVEVEQAARLKEITNTFYKTYGMDFE